MPDRWDGMTAGAFETIAEFDSVSPRDLLIADRVTTEARIVSLERDWTGIVESSAMTSTDDEHDPEGATIAFERAQAYSMLEQAVRDRTALQDALARIDEDSDFGLCQRCASPIGLERLLALPATLLCVECAR